WTTPCSSSNWYVEPAQAWGARTAIDSNVTESRARRVMPSGLAASLRSVRWPVNRGSMSSSGHTFPEPRRLQVPTQRAPARRIGQKNVQYPGHLGHPSDHELGE